MKNNFWKNRNVFITGCTGFLGSCITQHLLDSQANVTGLIKDWVPKSKLLIDNNITEINIVSGDLSDLEIIEKALDRHEIDTVIHLAAVTTVGLANRHPYLAFETNVKGTWNILEACRKYSGIKRIIVASSDKAYGQQKVLPYFENMPLQGRHPYDVSKSCADLICQSYFHSYKLPVCITRCGNFYGPGDLNYNRIIPGTIQSILKHEAPIIRSDGLFVRDYLYIEDAAEAYLKLSENMESKFLYGQAFNFSSEIRISVKNLVNKILKLMNSNLKPRILNQASNEIKNQYLSSEKAHKLLNWKSKHTLDEGLKKTIDWYKIFLNK